jgi:hypothetical protein
LVILTLRQMKLLFSVFIFFSISQLFSQNINIDPCAIFKEAMSNNNIDTLDHYLAMDDNQLSKQDRINLMTFKGAVLMRKTSYKFENDRIKQLSLIDSSYQLFTYAINMVDDEKLTIGYILRRYQTLSDHKPSYSRMHEDKSQLEDHGYKEDDVGFEL